MRIPGPPRLSIAYCHRSNNTTQLSSHHRHRSIITMSQNKPQTAAATAATNFQKRIQKIVDSQHLDDNVKEQWKSAMDSWTDKEFIYDDETIISLLLDENLLTVVVEAPSVVPTFLKERQDRIKLQKHIQALEKQSLTAKELTRGIEQLTAREASASKADKESWNGIENNYNGVFVHVPTYLHFVSGAYSLDKDLKAKIVSNIDISPLTDQNVLSDWVPNREHGVVLEETVYSNALFVVFQRIFSYLLRTSIIKPNAICDIIHQMVIAPLRKCGSRKYEKVDIGVLVQFDEDTKKRYKTLLTWEYKKTASFDEYETQSMVYGVDSMSISQRSVIEVQSRGIKLEKMEYKVFGLVPFTWREKHATENAVTHLRSFLYEGTGLDGLVRIIYGLIECLPHYLRERDLQHSGFPLSSVTSFHPDDQNKDVGQVYKSFDYRSETRRIKPSKRESQVKLYKRYVDENAKLIVDADDIHVLSIKYMAPDYLAPVTVENLMKIINTLKDLHAHGYIHGDIRLFNLLPGHGKIIDFDLSRKKDDTTPPKYAANLQCVSDGKRANVVKQHIEDNTIHYLDMSVDHDIESMKSVLMLYDGIHNNERNLDECQSLDDILGCLGNMCAEQKELVVSLSDETKDRIFGVFSSVAKHG